MPRAAVYGNEGRMNAQVKNPRIVLRLARFNRDQGRIASPEVAKAIAHIENARRTAEAPTTPEEAAQAARDLAALFNEAPVEAQQDLLKGMPDANCG